MTPLTARDLAALARAQRVVLSPLDHGTPEAWARAVAEALRDLFGAERAVVSAVGPGGPVLVASGVGDGALAEYEADFAADDEAGDIVLARPTPYYVEEDFARDDRFGAHARTAVYNEWYRAHGLTRAVGMFAVGTAPHAVELYARRRLEVAANVLLAGTPLSAGPGAGRARTLLALLQPALAASAEVWRRTAHAAAQAAALVDAVGAEAWLYDEAGRLVHESAAASGAAAPGLRASADALARAVVRAGAAGRPAPAGADGGGAGRLVASTLAATGPGGPAVLVAALRPAPADPDPDALRARFGLTRQEARVALLLARRRTNAEVADALCVSPKTARHHTERVLDKLGVERRTGVAAALAV